MFQDGVEKAGREPDQQNEYQRARQEQKKPETEEPKKAVMRMDKYWLTFLEPEQEYTFFERERVWVYDGMLKKMAGSSLLICILTLIDSIINDGTNLTLNCGLIGGAVFIQLFLFITSFTPLALIQEVLGLLFFLTGLLVTLAATMGAEAGHVSLIKVAAPQLIVVFFHTLNLQPTPIILIKTLLAASSSLSTCYAVLVCIYLPLTEAPFLAVSMFTVAGFMFEVSRTSEMTVRQHHATLIDNANEFAAIDEEKHELRTEVFLNVMEKMGVGLVDQENMVVDSPVEQANGLLQNLLKDENINKEMFDTLKDVVVLISSAGDIHQPNFEAAIKDNKVKLDSETERYILNLVDSADNAKPEKQPTFVTDMDGEIELPGGVHSPVHPSVGIQSSEQQTYSALESEVDNWEYNVFDLQKLTNNHALLLLGMVLFNKYNLLEKFKIDPTKLRNFLVTVEKGYRIMPYHNSVHATDVTRTVHYFLHMANNRLQLRDEEFLSIITASIIHDYDHPGTSNAYAIATSNELAMLYNDKMVLENHHSAQAFKILSEDDNNIFKELPNEKYRVVRKNMIELVLATDLGNHFSFVGQFKNAVSANTIDPEKSDSRLMLMKMALKCGDLGHAAKPLTLHKTWTLRITEEFYCQGDNERRQGLEIGPFMDRRKADLPKSQVGFMKFLVIPMFDEFFKYLDPETKLPCIPFLKANHEHWKKEQQKTAGETAGSIPPK